MSHYIKMDDTGGTASNLTAVMDHLQSYSKDFCAVVAATVKYSVLELLQYPIVTKY